MTLSDKVEEKHRETMEVIARSVDFAFNQGQKPPKVGFALLIFDFGTGDDRRMNYVSNAQRNDMVVAMKEMIAKFEGQAIEGGDTKQ